MTTPKSNQPEDRPKAHEQQESPAKPQVPIKAPSSQITEEPSTKLTQARFWPVPKGFRIADDEESGDQLFIGGLPGKPPEKK